MMKQIFLALALVVMATIVSVPTQALIMCDGCGRDYEEPAWCEERTAEYYVLYNVLTSCKIQQVANSCSLMVSNSGTDGDLQIESMLRDKDPFPFQLIAISSQSRDISDVSKLVDLQGGVCNPCDLYESRITATAYTLAGCQLRLMACGSTYDPNYKWVEPPTRQTCPSKKVHTKKVVGPNHRTIVSN